MRRAFEELWGEGEVGAEDGVVFVPDLGEGLWVLMEGVVDPLLSLAEMVSGLLEREVRIEVEGWGLGLRRWCCLTCRGRQR